MPDLTCTHRCPHLLETGKCTQNKCTFGHGAEEVWSEAVVVPDPMPNA